MTARTKKPRVRKAAAKPKRPAAESATRRSAEALSPFLDLLTPWQVKYLEDRSRIKKLTKSRRIGGTWIQALEDVLDCIEQPGLKVWFSSADKTAGGEYIDYILMWVGVANLLVQTVQVSESQLSDVSFEDPEALEVASQDDATATVVEFHNGSKITSLSSNPSQFRSKGGKVVLDEFAHHKRDRDLWKAAQPVAARGHSIRIISTQNGMSCAFYKLGNNAERKAARRSEKKLGDKYAWSIHEVTLVQAIDEGMLDQIEGRPTTQEERDAFIASIRAQCLSEAQYLEEYMCKAQDEAHALLPYSMIERVERDGILGLHQVTGSLYLGMDIGRVIDLTVIYVLELCGLILYTRHIVVLKNTEFSEQGRILWELLKHPKMVRAAIDARGIGMQLAEEAQKQFGTYHVDKVMGTPAIKDALATRMVQEFQDSTVLIPVDEQQREGLHAVAKTVSLTNTVRYDAKHDEENGHGDHFWALALGISAARTGGEAPADAVSSTTESVTTGFSESFGSYNQAGLSTWAAMS